MKALGLVIWITLVTGVIYAQNEDSEINTNRPDQSSTPVLVPKGALQIELGSLVEYEHVANYKQTNYVFNNTLVKFGLSNNVELRLGGGYLGTESNDEQSKKIRSFSPVAIGLKVHLFDEHGLLPQSAIISHISINLESTALANSGIASDLIFSFSHTLSERWSITYNTGVIYGDKQIATFLYTLTWGLTISKAVGLFAESYGFFPYKLKADHRIDAGITYKILPLLQIDLSGGVGLQDNPPDYFIGTGLSVRLIK